MQNERRQGTQDTGLVTLVILTAIYLVLLYTLFSDKETPIVTNETRFVDNGDGTITDTRLNLMWSKDTLSEEEVNHEAAEKTCAELDLAGYTDWRLPTVEELFALADRTRHSPAIDTEAFPDTKSDWYWTSTISAWSSVRAWVVYFGYGYVNYGRRDNNNAFVRAVRSVPRTTGR